MNLTDYLKTFKKTHLIFDFDETLFKLILPWEKFEENIKQQLIEWDKQIYDDYIKEKIDLNALQNKYVLKFGDRARKLVDKANIDFETKYFKNVVPNKELLEFLKHAKNYKLFIWSANTRYVIEKVLKNYGIDNMFDQLVTRLEVDMLKPNPEGFNKIYDPQVPKNNYLFIGDSDNDKNAAKNAQLDFFLIKYFQHKM